jgi:hypothetical protein
MMGATIGAPDTLKETLDKLVDSQAIRLAVVAEGSGDVNVAEGAEGEESTMTVLRAGGSIRCAVALALAKQLNIGPGDVGAIMNALNIKIRHCSLGCFK